MFIFDCCFRITAADTAYAVLRVVAINGAPVKAA